VLDLAVMLRRADDAHGRLSRSRYRDRRVCRSRSSRLIGWLLAMTFAMSPARW